MRILMVGDTHGNTDATFDAIDYASQRGADLIIQVGDFGYWPGRDRGFLENVERALEYAELQLWFIDGNHEDHDALANLPGSGGVSEHITYVARGFTKLFHSYKWLFLGGAVSVDRKYRTPGFSWFPQEAITSAQATEVVKLKGVDVVVAHDTPYVCDELRSTMRSRWPENALLATKQHVEMLRGVQEALKPSAWFHGHYHYRYNYDLDGTRLVGLGRDGYSVKDLCVLVDESGTEIFD